MANERILIVEDEPDIVELLRYNLTRDGYDVLQATTGEAALDIIKESSPDLMLLDLMLPRIDGLEVCRRVRANADTKHLPIIMLTAKGEEVDIVTGLELGADDYVTKPFSPRILLARVRAVIRRNDADIPGDNDAIQIHNLTIHPGRHEVTVDGELVTLTRTEFQVLHYLARRPGWVFTRYQIVDAVHGDDYIVTERSVDVQIVGLRKKLDTAGKHIETVRGVGYRFGAP